MKIIDNINAVLHQKGTQVWSISPDATVFEAIQFMAEKNIGALLVMKADQLLGMFSERDYTRKVALKGKSSKQTTVKEIMTTPIVTVRLEHTVEECMRLMTDHRVRHLPVVENNRVIGVVSIGNLVNWIISTQSSTIDQLENYIAGQYPG
ncbi:MAG: CBS domain-containing protein [Verrucomicrobia bacterium]|nr:CBS domain-containing protein [Verrucomicrobiota bacterium]